MRWPCRPSTRPSGDLALHLTGAVIVGSVRPCLRRTFERPMLASWGSRQRPCGGKLSLHSFTSSRRGRSGASSTPAQYLRTVAACSLSAPSKITTARSPADWYFLQSAQRAPRHTETALSNLSLPALLPARMIKRRTGLVGSFVRPVHLLNRSTSRCSVSRMPSISLATVRQVQKDGEENTEPNKAGAVMARVSVMAGLVAVRVRLIGRLVRFIGPLPRHGPHRRPRRSPRARSRPVGRQGIRLGSASRAASCANRCFRRGGAGGWLPDQSCRG